MEDLFFSNTTLVKVLLFLFALILKLKPLCEQISEELVINDEIDQVHFTAKLSLEIWEIL
jgi:hypothetical protein